MNLDKVAPPGTFLISCPKPGRNRKMIRRELIKAIHAFEESKGLNLPIIGFRSA